MNILISLLNPGSCLWTLSSAVVEIEHHHQTPFYFTLWGTFLYCLHLLENLISSTKSFFEYQSFSGRRQEFRGMHWSLVKQWLMTQGAPAARSSAAGSERSGWLWSLLPNIQGHALRFQTRSSQQCQKISSLQQVRSGNVIEQYCVWNFYMIFILVKTPWTFLLCFVDLVQNSLKNHFMHVTDYFFQESLRC